MAPVHFLPSDARQPELAFLQYLAVISRLNVLAGPLYKSHDTKHYKFQRQ